MTLPMAVLILGVHIFLTLLPIVAAAVVASAFGIKDRLLLLSIGLCGLLGTGYLTFWIFWVNAAAGRIFTIALTPTLVIAVAWLGFPRRTLLKELGSAYLPPIFLWIASSLLIFSFGAVYTSSQALTTTAEARFVPSGLPTDNEIPFIVAHALQASHRPIPHPLYGVWHSSDRPPLQAGVYLSQEALLPGSDAQAVHYEVVGILLQGLWIFGVWGLLATVRASARLVALVATAILFSGFTLVNTFYTWPKLFAAAYLALLAAMLLTPRFKRLRGSGIAGVTAGALAGGALLGHEGSGLALFSFIIVMAVQRKVPSKKFVLGAIAILVVTQGSWMAYQKVIDPPGDYLARLQIANQMHFWGERSSLQAVIIDTYEKTPFGTIVSDKIANIEKPFEGIPFYLADTGHLIKSYFLTGKTGSTARQSSANDLIRINFFLLVPSVGFLALGFLAWLVAAIRDRRRRPTPVMRLAGTIWIFLVVNIVTWSLILFGPGFTVIHQGTYVTELLMFTACVIGLWGLSRRLCTALVLVQASLTVLVYGSNGLPNLPRNVANHLNPQMLALSIVGLALTVGALSFMATWRWKGHDEDLPNEHEWRTPDSDHGLHV
jgi:hypothetical protein